jgi:hypothetical protein
VNLRHAVRVQHCGAGQPREAASAAVSANDVFSLPELCAIILRPSSRAEVSDLKAIGATAAASAVCKAWHASVATAKVWRAACHARWPSTARLPLAPTTDYRRLYQSRAIAQRAEARNDTPSDVYFLLEMRSRDGRPMVSECLSLGSCSFARQCTFVWEVEHLHLPRSWVFEGCGLWRRGDGLVHGFGEWELARGGGGLYEASEEEDDFDGLYEDDEEDEEDEMGSFIDDDSAEEEEGEEGSEEGSEEEGAEEEEEGEEEEGEEEEGEEGEEEEAEEEAEDGLVNGAGGLGGNNVDAALDDAFDDLDALGAGNGGGMSDEDGDGLTSPEGSDAEEEGGVVRASCRLEGEWEPRALLRIDCCRGRVPTVELSFEIGGDQVIKWSKLKRILGALRWG